MAFLAIAAILLDAWFGEPEKYHPLVGFGKIVAHLEVGIRNREDGQAAQTIKGFCAWFVLVVPLSVSAWFLLGLLPDIWANLVAVAVLYFAVGLKSLHQHAGNVLSALEQSDMPKAREALGLIVSRDTVHLDETAIAAATVETVLENGNDAVIAPLFWFLVAGAPGALAYRLINTLDAMWGYRNARYQHFGCWAAKTDDWVNWLPARLCALSYCLLGNGRAGWKAMTCQGPQADSPNAGLVMAAGAGALDIQLGGETQHHGAPRWRPQFGYGRTVETSDIKRAGRLLTRVVVCWLAVLSLFCLFNL